MVTFGQVHVGVYDDAGVLVVTPQFEGSQQDERDWNLAVEWAWYRGFKVPEYPTLELADGTEVYSLTASETGN